MSTSLFDAIRNADVSMVTSLVKENPSLAQEKDQRGSTALLLATYYGHMDIVRVGLGEAGLWPGAVKSNGE